MKTTCTVKTSSVLVATTHTRRKQHNKSAMQSLIKGIKYCTRTTELYNSQAGERREWRQFRVSRDILFLVHCEFLQFLGRLWRLGGNCDPAGSQSGLRKGLKMQWGLLITPGCAQARYPLISSPSHWPDQHKKSYSIRSLALYWLKKTQSAVSGGQAYKWYLIYLWKRWQNITVIWDTSHLTSYDYNLSINPWGGHSLGMALHLFIQTHFRTFKVPVLFYQQ